MTTTPARPADPPVEIVATRDAGAVAGLARRPIRGGPVKMGPVLHLAAERERLAAIEWRHFEPHPIAPSIGAELHGIDLTRDLSGDAIGEIRRALFEYKVIFFRDQPLSSAQHVSFAKRFGELEIHPFIPPNAEHPELVRFSKSAEVAGYENAWHHDVTWRDTPSMGAVLRAISVPPVGGDTLFCDMYAVYEGLDNELKARVDGATAVHDYMRAFAGQVPADRHDEFRQRYPQVEHPVVCTHAATGRKYLYVNRIFTSHIVGLDPAESEALLDRLCRECDAVEYHCRFRWQNDSIAFWDNRAAQHYAASDYWPDVRVMERASIVGDRPVR